MADSIDLGDLEDVEILQEVERVFGISITDREAEQTFTVGDLYDLLDAKYGGSATAVCLSQIAFHRLRRALRELGVSGPIAPATPVSVIASIGGGSVRRAWTCLARQSGLNLPGFETPFTARLPEWTAWPLRIAFMAAGLAVFLATDRLWSPELTLLGLCVSLPIVAVAGTLIWHRLFGTIPRRILTVGDLAREAAGHSFVGLAQKRIAGRPDRWSALLAIVRHVSGHKRVITRETTFYAL